MPPSSSRPDPTAQRRRPSKAPPSHDGRVYCYRASLPVEQSTAAALRLAEFAYVLRTDSVALAGPSALLREDPRVLDLYLGGGE